MPTFSTRVDTGATAGATIWAAVWAWQRVSSHVTKDGAQKAGARCEHTFRRSGIICMCDCSTDEQES